MANINELLPFAINVGANVYPQASYQGLTSRLTGFSAGVALSDVCNKVWRQSAFSSSMIGQFTIHNALEDVLDDGNVDEYERKFKKAVQAVGATPLRRASTGGTAAAATITLTPAPTTYTNLFFLADITTALSAGATLDANGLGARPLVRNDGTPLQVGDASQLACVLVAAVGSDLRVTSLATRAVQSGSMNYVPTARVGGAANAITLTTIPAILQYNEGSVYSFKPTANNTGATTLSVSGFTPKPVSAPNGDPLTGNEFRSGQVARVIDAGASFILLPAFGATNQFAERVPGLFYAYADPSPGYTTVAGGVWTKVLAEQEQYDAEGWYNPALSRYQPQQPGLYYITGDCSYGSDAALPTTGLRAFLNGSPSFSTQIGDIPGTQYSTSGNGSRAVVTGITYLNGISDYVEMYGYMSGVDSNGFRRAAKLRWGGWWLGRP